MPCEFGKQDGDAVSCSLLIEKMGGHRCGIYLSGVTLKSGEYLPGCRECLHKQGDDSVLDAWAKFWLRIHLLEGDLRRHHRDKPYDADALFQRYKEITTEEKHRKMIQEMFHYKSSVSPNNGGLELEVIAQTLRTLADV